MGLDTKDFPIGRVETNEKTAICDHSLKKCDHKDSEWVSVVRIVGARYDKEKEQ